MPPQTMQLKNCLELLLVDVGDGESDGLMDSEFENLVALDAQRTRLLRRRATYPLFSTGWSASDGALLSDSLVDALTREPKPLAPALQPYAIGGVAADAFIRAAMAQVDESKLTVPAAEGARCLFGRK